MSIEYVIQRLEKEAKKRVGQRASIETRWVEDLKLFHGQYDDDLVKSLRDQGRSTLFIDVIRQKTTTLEAYLENFLFPTDDRNWGIRPTPEPQLSNESPVPPAWGLSPPAAFEGASAPRTTSTDEARERASRMERAMHDVLVESGWAAECRQVIQDACRLGTGILKGPVVGDTSTRKWVYEPGADYEMREQAGHQPQFRSVDPWHYFPARRGEGVYERHLMSPSGLRKLAKHRDFDRDAIRRLLEDGPSDRLPSFVRTLDDLSSGAASSRGSPKCFQVWEYHGRLESDDLIAVARYLDDPGLLVDLGVVAELPEPPEPAEASEGEVSSEALLENEESAIIDEDAFWASLKIDPLRECDVVLWFCGDELLRFGIHHLDSGESLYSTFSLFTDRESEFGQGIPRIGRDSQIAIAAAWRAMMDNAGLTTGPQIVIDTNQVEPEEPDNWTLKGRKIWLRKSSASAVANAPAFEVFSIPSNQAEMANIIELARRNLDEETGVSTLAQGEQGTHTTTTRGGIAMLLNASNTVFRRMIQAWDDGITVPSIRRLYDYMMQFSDDESIKGDYAVEARGSSVLLVREIQSQNLMTLISNFGLGSLYEGYLKDGGLPLLRKLIQTMMVPAGEVLKSEEDLQRDAEAAAQAQQAPQQSPEQAAAEAQAALTQQTEAAKAEREMALAQMKHQFAVEMAVFDRDTKLLELANRRDISLDQATANLEKAREAVDSRERLFAAELGAEQRFAEQGLRNPNAGSGGYL